MTTVTIERELLAELAGDVSCTCHVQNDFHDTGEPHAASCRVARLDQALAAPHPNALAASGLCPCGLGTPGQMACLRADCPSPAASLIWRNPAPHAAAAPNITGYKVINASALPITAIEGGAPTKCHKDGLPCYVAGDEPHWRCGTVQCGPTAYAPHPGRNCPRCDSTAPHLHPAVQFEGEVEVCVDDYHLIPTNQNTDKHRAAVLEKRNAAKLAAPQPAADVLRMH